jgi:hypothetical protein
VLAVYYLVQEREEAKVNSAIHFHKPEFLGASRRNVLAAILFIFSLGAYYLSRNLPKIPPAMQEFLLGVVAAAAVHLLDRLWLVHDFEEWARTLESKMVESLSHQMRGLVVETQKIMEGLASEMRTMVSSLQAMDSAGVVRIYGGREQAAKDINREVNNPACHSVNLIGISLNDFISGREEDLREAWRTMYKRIVEGSLSVRILLVDPDCIGARLRSVGERRKGNYPAGRLKHDVEAAIGEISDLLNLCRAKNQNNFDCKLYRVAPILFLFQVDSASYVQQYYFWPSRNSNQFPMMRIGSTLASGGTHVLHEELKDHFDWIWNKASVTLDQLQTEYSCGTDAGISQCGTDNIITDSDLGYNRMRFLLQSAGSATTGAAGDAQLQPSHKICIQGISLHSFFSPDGTSLREVVYQLINADDAAIQILFLDPECEQAKLRGYREHTFQHPKDTYADYCASGAALHATSTLLHHTNQATANLKSMIMTIASSKPKGWKVKVEAGMYDSAPYCFLLRVNDRMLVEQYHYGTLLRAPSRANIVLGKEFPLVEYMQKTTDLYDPLNKLPFSLLESHFQFAFVMSKKMDVQQWADEAPRVP